MTLGPVLAAGGPQELFDEAVTAFAQKMGIARPDATLDVDRDRSGSPSGARGGTAGRGRFRHRTQPQDQAVSGQQVIEALLGHEARYWARTAASRGLDLDLSVLRLAVALGCMIGADSEAAAVSAAGSGP